MRKQRSLVDCLAEIQDMRTGNGKRHDLVEVLVVAICAIFSEVEGFVDMAEWARAKEPWLKRYLRLENGIPSHDTFNRVFRILDPKQFERVFRNWISGVVGTLREHYAFDGKVLRGSAAAGDSPVHMVSVFATRLGVVLGQEKVADKSNEITAIPLLLESIAVKGCLISIDAMVRSARLPAPSDAWARTTCWRSRAISRRCTKHCRTPLPGMGATHTALSRRVMAV